jgi:hypothetical protein
MPCGGWQQAPDNARPFLDQLTAGALELLETRGIAVVRANIPPARQEEVIHWGKKLAHDINEADVTWYIDGSLLDGPREVLGRTGAGFAGVLDSGQLVAYGHATPPKWICTIPGVEAWAFTLILRHTFSRKSVITDCLGNVHALDRGMEWASDPCRPLARLWKPIFEDPGHTGPGMLAWMPAHTAASAVGVAKRSDGTILTAVDRRANALVDGFAKLAAGEQQVPRYIAKLFKAAEIAIEHADAAIGVTCKAANNALVPHETRNDDGSVNLVKKRDSIPMAQLQRREATVQLRAAAVIHKQITRDKRAAAKALVALRNAAKKRAKVEAKVQAAAAVRERLSLKREADLGRPTARVVWRDPVKVAANNRLQNARRSALKRSMVNTEAGTGSSSSSSTSRTMALCRADGIAQRGQVPDADATALATRAVDPPPVDGAVGRWWAAKLAKRARLTDSAGGTPGDQTP